MLSVLTRREGDQNSLSFPTTKMAMKAFRFTKCLRKTFLSMWFPKGFDAPNKFYLSPICNFPLRTGTSITACCGLWFGFSVTFASSSSAFHCAFSFSISTRNWTLRNNKREIRWHFSGNNWINIKVGKLPLRRQHGIMLIVLILREVRRLRPQRFLRARTQGTLNTPERWPDLYELFSLKDSNIKYSDPLKIEKNDLIQVFQNFTWVQSPTFHSGQGPALQLVVACGLVPALHLPCPPLHFTMRFLCPLLHETEHCGIKQKKVTIKHLR